MVTKKVKEEANSEQPTEEEKVELTEEEVWDVLKFARQLNGPFTYLNPDLVSARMKDITLNPMSPTESLLEKAMKEPKAHELDLQKFSQSFELTSMVYKRLLGYLSNMLSFDITYTSNAKGEDYKSTKYKKDLDSVESFLEKFDYKKELRIVTREMLRNDAYFGCLINTGDKYVLQELPSEYCKITGRWEHGFMFSFNMYWFIQPGVDINMYPPFFKKKYREIWSSSNTTQKYNPSVAPDMRSKSSWVYWVDIPVTLGVCFKLSPELATRLPYFSPLFNDLVLQGLMRNLQKNMNMAAASKMIMGEVPLLNKETKATIKDSIAISPELLGKFLALVKSAITDAVRIASAPLSNIKGISFETDNDMYDKYLRTALASSGVNTNLIFSSNIKPNAIETQLSLNVDEQMMTAIYEQFNDFMDYFANKLTKNFKFKFIFEGTEFYINREKRLETAMNLFNQGIVLPQKIAAAIGMKPSELRKHMEESEVYGFMAKLTPPSVESQRKLSEILPQTNTPGVNKTTPKIDSNTGEQVKRGRPKKSDSELGDDGLSTRETASNIARGGEI